MNDACCSRPPLKSDYKPVGVYETLDNGMKCYKVGKPSATHAVIFGYDALGFTTPQLHGADLLAALLQTTVYVPDFFRGNPIDGKMFSMSAEERGPLLQAWLSGAGDMTKGKENVLLVQAELAKKNPAVKKWAWQGFCWGGKLAILSSGAGSPFAVTAASHPGRLDVADVKALAIPHICLLSGEDGSDEEAATYKKALEGSGQEVVYERFQDQVHGWMSARANMDDEKARSEFERGYEMVAKFFTKFL